MDNFNLSKILCLTIKMRMLESFSLKDKRMVINSIKGRMRNRYNVSLAEVGDSDNYKIAILSIAMISSDGSYLMKVGEKIIYEIEAEQPVEILDVDWAWR